VRGPQAEQSGHVEHGAQQVIFAHEPAAWIARN
jgi:hypothetical protein